MPLTAFNRVLLILPLLLLCALSAGAEEINVPADEATIQDAIDLAVDGDTVVVADGTYDGKGFFNVNFLGKAITVTSENGPDDCIIDCGLSGRGFIFENDEGAGSVLHGLTIQSGYAHHGGAVYCYYASPTISGNILTSNGALYRGGAIHCYQSSPLIEGNVITFNSAGWAGAINCYRSSPSIQNNEITFNTATQGEGGGLRFDDSSSVLVNNLVAGNLATTWGGGIACRQAELQIRNCTITGNEATDFGGGIGCMESSAPSVTSSILYWDAADEGAEISLRSHNLPSTLSINYSCVAGGQAGVYLEEGCVLNWWGGMITADPQFVSGPGGSTYLSQIAAGQSENSPCINAGNPAGPMINGTTRTDSAPDTGVVDMGYHYEIWEEPVTTIDAGPRGTVDSPTLIFSFSATDNRDASSELRFSWRLEGEDWSAYSAATRATYRDLRNGSYTFSVRSRDRDGNVDSTPPEWFFTVTDWDDSADWGPLVTGPGPGPVNPSLVRTSRGEWEAYAAGRCGVNVATGDLDGLGYDEIVTGPGPGENLGPHVRGWSMGGDPLSGISFFAYGTPRYGVNVACGDIDGDGADEIITGAGPGAVFGPHVRGWNYSGGTVSAIDGVNFMAYGTLKWGVNVTCGDIDGDGYEEIVTGAGPGDVFGPHVRGWDHDGGASTEPIAGVSYFAYTTHLWGVNVACGDIDGDGIDEIITGAGPGSEFSAHVRGWNYDGSELASLAWVNFFALTSGYGVVVAAWDLDEDGLDEIITMPGAGSEHTAWLQAYRRNGLIMELVSEYSFTAYDSWMTHGGTVAGGHFSTSR